MRRPWKTLEECRREWIEREARRAIDAARSWTQEETEARINKAIRDARDLKERLRAKGRRLTIIRDGKIVHQEG